MPGDMTGKCFLRTKKQEAFNPMLGLIYITVKVRQAKNEMNRALGHLCAHIG